MDGSRQMHFIARTVDGPPKGVRSRNGGSAGAVRRQVDHELDAAVAEAYGWSADLSDEEIGRRLVALNAERAKEESRGVAQLAAPAMSRCTPITEMGSEADRGLSARFRTGTSGVSLGRRPAAPAVRQLRDQVNASPSGGGKLSAWRSSRSLDGDFIHTMNSSLAVELASFGIGSCRVYPLKSFAPKVSSRPAPRALGKIAAWRSTPWPWLWPRCPEGGGKRLRLAFARLNSAKAGDKVGRADGARLRARR